MNMLSLDAAYGSGATQDMHRAAESGEAPGGGGDDEAMQQQTRQHARPPAGESGFSRLSPQQQPQPSQPFQKPPGRDYVAQFPPPPPQQPMHDAQAMRAPPQQGMHPQRLPQQPPHPMQPPPQPMHPMQQPQQPHYAPHPSHPPHPMHPPQHPPPHAMQQPPHPQHPMHPQQQPPPHAMHRPAGPPGSHGPPAHPVQLAHPAHPSYMEKMQSEGNGPPKSASLRGVSSAAATEIDVVAKKGGSKGAYSNNKIIIMVAVIAVFLVLGILVACLVARNKKQNGKGVPEMTGGAVHGAPSFSMYGRDTNPFMYGAPTAGKSVPQFVGGGDEFFLPPRAWNESASVFGRR